MATKVVTEQLEFWTRNLSGIPEQLQLPADQPRTVTLPYAANRVPLTLSRTLTEGLRNLSRNQDVSLFTVLLSAWAALLGRWSGQENVVVGTRVANRVDVDSDGPLVNIVALRVGLQDDPKVPELLERVQGTASEARARADIPFERVAAALGRDHDSMLQVLLDLDVPPEMSTGVEPARTSFELALSLRQTEEGCTGTLEYASDLFERETIERLISSWQVLLEGMSARVAQPISRLPILTEADRARVVRIFNDTAREYPRERLIHELFEERVRSHPTALAVRYEGEALTYEQLNMRANQLARHLCDHGAELGEYIPIVMPRSLQMLIAQIAVLKSGGVYVPIDPNTPVERQAFMIRDCGARRVLAAQSPPKGLEASPDWIDCEASAGAIGRSSTANLSLAVKTPRAAYVMYTSGSTGAPKGVVVAHHSVNRLAINNGYAEIDGTDCIAHCSNPAFDASTFEIWGALLNGASVLIVPHCVLLDEERFAEVLSRHGVTALFQTTALFNQRAITTPEVFGNLRYLLFGGEVSDPNAAAKVLREGCPRNLLHVYGPTETTTFATSYATASVSEGATSLPIGQPISNTQIYILDRHQQPVPPGFAGEIYIGGPGVALGYLNRPELTAERFVSDPFSSDPQARLYRSGDIARWRTDGNIEFLGRNDQQVKLRGFRIELGEIEAQLTRHPQVKEAVVLAREDVPGQKRLVAYLTGCAESTVPIDALRSHLKTALPDYMIPSTFVKLESLPLTPNGKVDRRALPAPESSAYTSREYEPPRGEAEETLAGIWQDVLHVERVGRHDNFFELGGHSLLMVHMLERLRRVGLTADVSRVFESGDLAELASALSAEAATRLEIAPNRIPSGCKRITPEMLPLVELSQADIDSIAQSVPGGAANIQDIYPLAPLQEGLLFHHKLDERGDTYVLPMLLALSSQEKVDALLHALQQVMDRHDTLRTALLSEHLPRPVQVVWRHASLPVEALALDPARDAIEQLKERMRPELQKLDLGQAPLMRLQVATDVRSGQWFALLQIHHVMADHESVETMLAEVKAYIDGGAQVLPEPVPFRDHVAQALAHAKAHDAEVFFRRKLGDVEEPTAPFRLLDVRGDGSRIERSCQVLDLTLSRRLRAQARRAGVSPATLFHAGWALVVSGTSGRDDVVFGTVLLGRLKGSAGAQRTLGIFINTLPLRLHLRGITAKELVAQSQRELVDLLSHEQTSLSVAQRCSGVGASVPLFSTLINYLHSTLDIETGQPSIASGIRVLASQEWTNFPIALSIYDQGDGFGLMMKTNRSLDPERVTAYLRTALHSLVNALEHAPDSLVSDLSILPESERQQVIRSFNATQKPYPSEPTVHELFEKQAERTPDAIAAVYQGQSLTYAALNRRANQLARYLRDKGVCPDQPVGICVERGLEMVVGMLGILKAGGAYVPLDPDYPSRRWVHMLRDAAPAVVLMQERLRKRLPETKSQIVMLDRDWPQITRKSVINLDPLTQGVRPDHLAYVIYTSGSTGQPKGVMVEHRHVVGLWRSLESIYREAADCQRIAVNASFNFDASVKQFVQLLSGRTLVLIPQETRLDAGSLLRFLDENRVQGIDCTPSQLKTWMAEGLLDRDSSLRVVLVGGEAIDPELWGALAHCSRTAFYNVYGPTECTVDAACTHITNRTAGPSIGRPMENKQIYILDHLDRPAPIGVTGEIYIGGAGVARGYLNRPEITAEKFIADPFSGDPHARVYKTGDLGRWRADGTIEYLGRDDGQVKIRGFRIELGEIEAQLALHEHVKQVVVVAHEDELKDKRLVAYVAADLSQLKGLRDGADEAGVAMVAQWKQVHDETYTTGLNGPSFVGWNSSYTGQPIAHAEMQEWLTSTIDRIKALRPRKILEVGCGVGLLLQHLAPESEVYVGTDFAPSALEKLSRWMSSREDLKHVELLQRAATEMQDLTSGTFDTVVLNSVVQYFPDINYLIAVLKEAVRLLSPGGKIFIGDVRHLGLLPMFHGGVQLSKAAATVSVGDLKRRIARAMAQDKELVIDPQFFWTLPGRVSGISAADVQLKRGLASNELTRYRYDVVLRTGEQIDPATVCESLEWPGAFSSVAEFAEAARERRWPALRLQSIPDARLAREAAAKQLIETSDEHTDANALRRRLNELQWEEVDPEKFWEWAHAHGYAITVNPGREGCFDVQLVDRQRADQVRSAVSQPLDTGKPWSAYANDPLENGLRQLLIPQLRQHLKERLPEYMIPSAWVVIRQLPLTPNGKVDRRALPPPSSRGEELGEYLAPQTEVEQVLAEIWSQVLQVDQVGVNDNFFEIGGHSILAMQVIVRIRTSLSIEMPMSVLFDHPTIRQLSAAVEEVRQAQLMDDIEGGGSEMEDLLAKVATMPESEVQRLTQELRMRVRS